MANNAQILEAFLFYEGGEAKKKALQKVLEWNNETLEASVQALKEVLADRGIALFVTDDTVGLKTAPACSEVIARIEKDVRERDLGHAGLEVLAIVLYRGPSTKSEIDFVRGVNSSSTIRHLQLRGLIEKTKQQDTRSTVYTATSDALGYLGVTDVSALPEFGVLREAIVQFEKATQPET